MDNNLVSENGGNDMENEWNIVKSEFTESEMQTVLNLLSGNDYLNSIHLNLKGYKIKMKKLHEIAKHVREKGSAKGAINGSR